MWLSLFSYTLVGFSLWMLLLQVHTPGIIRPENNGLCQGMLFSDIGNQYSVTTGVCGSKPL
jgi:hypothetical protein